MVEARDIASTIDHPKQKYEKSIDYSYLTQKTSKIYLFKSKHIHLGRFIFNSIPMPPVPLTSV